MEGTHPRILPYVEKHHLWAKLPTVCDSYQTNGPKWVITTVVPQLYQTDWNRFLTTTEPTPWAAQIELEKRPEIFCLFQEVGKFCPDQNLFPPCQINATQGFSPSLTPLRGV